MRLKDRVAIVTGGANGIGRATALLFAAEGARVVVADRDTRAGESCIEEMRAGGASGLFVPTDVSDDGSVAALVRRAVDAFGGLDILVNCAGVAIPGSVVDTSPDRWQRVLDVNLASACRTCRNAIPHMIERGGGSIVNVASLQGLYGWVGWAAYAASKAGMIGLTRQVAVEYADRDIRVNAVSPGGIVTELGANTARLETQYTSRPGDEPGAPGTATASASESRPEAAPRARLRRAGQPRDVAYAVLFLASDEAAHISGQNLVVDGITSARVEG